jgi:hypothetical protein
MEISVQKYTTELAGCKTNILKILEETEEKSNTSTNILNAQTEALTRIDNKLDIIQEELTISDKIVRSMMGLFTFFSKKNITKVGANIKKDPRCINIEYADNKDPYYNEVYGYLERLKTQAINQREILTIHNGMIDNVIQKADGSIRNIKIIESNMKKI